MLGGLHAKDLRVASGQQPGSNGGPQSNHQGDLSLANDCMSELRSGFFFSLA